MTYEEALKLVRDSLTELSQEPSIYQLICKSILEAPDKNVPFMISYYLGRADATFDLTGDTVFFALGEIMSLFTGILALDSVSVESLDKFMITYRKALALKKNNPQDFASKLGSTGRSYSDARPEVVASKRSTGGNRNNLN